MTNNADENNVIPNSEQDDLNEDKGFEVSNIGQNLGGGKSEDNNAAGENQHALGKGDGSFDDEDEFSKTDQSTAQAAPGQTITYENQGGS